MTKYFSNNFEKFPSYPNCTNVQAFKIQFLSFQIFGINENANNVEDHKREISAKTNSACSSDF